MAEASAADESTLETPAQESGAIPEDRQPSAKRSIEHSSEYDVSLPDESKIEATLIVRVRGGELPRKEDIPPTTRPEYAHLELDEVKHL